MSLDAPSSNKSGCAESPEYSAIIDFVARTTYNPEKLGDLDQLKNKHNCSITSKDDAIAKAVEEVTTADPSISSFPKPSKVLDTYRAGIGLGASFQNGQMTIDRVLANGPADGAGLKAGDKIKSIDGSKIEEGNDPTAALTKLTATVNEPSHGGMGMGLIRDNGGPTKINSIDKDSTAQRMGLLDGDTIVAIDGNRISNNSLLETNKLLSGQPGSSISLTIERGGQQLSIAGYRSPEPFPTAVLDVARDGKDFEISVARRPVEIPTVTSKVGGVEVIPGGTQLPDDAAYLRVENFYSFNTVQQMWDALNQPVNAQGDTVGNSKSLVLDLRGNPGGNINDVVLASSLFANQGSVYTINSRVDSDPSAPKFETQEVHLTPNGAEEVTLQGTTPGASKTSPYADSALRMSKPKQLIVLIDDHTAGSAELLADSLKVNAGATVLGSRSTGFGVVSRVGQATPDVMMSVPIGRIYTASGKWLGDNRDTRDGVIPDIQVRNSNGAQYGAKSDEQLEAAIQLINEKRGK